MSNKIKITIALISTLLILVFCGIILVFCSIIQRTQSLNIENVTVYENKRILKLLNEQYPNEEFEIVCYLDEIRNHIELFPIFERQIGKKLMVRPIGQIGKEFLIYYYFDKDEDIEIEFKNYYKEYSEKLDALEEYVQPIIDEIFEGKEKGKDYKLGIENLEDGEININFYISDEGFKKSEIPIYYNYFEIIADKLAQDFENNGEDKYSINITLYRAVHSEFDNLIKHLPRNAINIMKNDINFYKKHIYSLSMDNGEIFKESYDYFLKGYINKIKKFDDKKESDIKNLTIKMKKEILGVLEEKFEEEADIIHYLGKGSFNNEMIFVNLNYGSEDKFLVTYPDAIKYPNAYGNILELENSNITELTIFTDYIENIINENLKEITEDKDYIIAVDVYNDNLQNSIKPWLSTIKNIDDYFYTEPFTYDCIFREDLRDSCNNHTEELDTTYRNINIVLYLKDNEFNKENSDLYYNYFDNIANKFVEKIESNKSNIEKLEMNIIVYRLEEDDFNYIKEFSNKALYSMLIYVSEIEGSIYEDSYSFKIKYDKNRKIIKTNEPLNIKHFP